MQAASRRSSVEYYSTRMITPPSQLYNGLTIVIDKPSRFDTTHLLTGQPGQWLEDEVIAPVKLANCEVRTCDEKTPFRQGTNRVALLGPSSASSFGGVAAQHGYPLTIAGRLPACIGFYPQDCCDHRNIEWATDEDNEEDTNDREIKDASPTKRSNYRFWTKWHLRKFLFDTPKIHPKLEIKPYPNLDELCKLLDTIKDEDLYLDIETSRIHRCITCIGFTTTSLWPRIYVVPAYLHTGAIAYSNFSLFYRSFLMALLRNNVVAHNASFDLLILHAFYKFPLPVTVYDTMLANHRCFPEIEKSLAHVIAQWTYLPYHKDECIEPFNRQGELRLWNYNAKDVYSLKLIKDAQLSYSEAISGLSASISQANSMIVPYLENSLLGLGLDQSRLLTTGNSLSIAAKQYAKIASILTGVDSFNPGSPLQCKKFFHDKLHYPVVARTKEGKPQLGKKQLYQLMLRFNNPLIPVIIKYRLAAKAASTLETPLFSTL